MQTTFRYRFLLAAGLPLLFSCASEPGATPSAERWVPIPVAALDENAPVGSGGGGSTESGTNSSTSSSTGSSTGSLRASYARALAARDRLFRELSAALGEAIGTPAAVASGEAPGPAGAIDVCREVAPRIAREVSASERLLIGRTGVRLRNPANRPPEWATVALAARPETPLAWHRNGEDLAVILPIRMMSLCMQCHGPREAIDPAVQAAIAANYPLDEATGFAENELRGWFWIEVPVR
jgi:hypothetical protein